MKEQTKNRLWVVGVGVMLGGCIGCAAYYVTSVIRSIPAFIDWAVMLWNEKEEES